MLTATLALPGSPLAGGPGFPVSLQDDLGHTVTLPEQPRRIVSLAPSNTEILYALGASGQVVAVTEYCDYPPETRLKPRVGGFSNPSLERIVAFQPDLVLAARFNPLEILEGLRNLGTPVFALAPRTLDEALAEISVVGALIGRPGEARTLLERLRKRVQAVQAVVGRIPSADRPRVLWGRLNVPMYTAGPGSFIGSLIALSGGVNIASDAQSDWIQIGLETVVSRNPEVIVVSEHAPDEIHRTLARLKTTSGWGAVAAIRSERVHSIHLDLLGRPGPRIVDGLEALARALHPERFDP